MARIRTIKPEFWGDEKVGRLKRDERLLFIGLWNLADDKGVIKANANYIRGQLFSYDEDLRTGSVESWLASLVNARMLIPFVHQDESYFIIRTFREHQLINRPSKSKIPDEIIDSMNTHGVIIEHSQPERKGKEGKGKEQGKETQCVNLPFNSEIFENAWILWKKYKKEQFKFYFKSFDSEQAQLHKLQNLSGGDEKNAIAIINESIAQGWQGLFQLKKQNDGKRNNGEKSERAIAKLAREVLSGDKS